MSSSDPIVIDDDASAASSLLDSPPRPFSGTLAVTAMLSVVGQHAFVGDAAAGESLVLVRERDNEYDRNAVLVLNKDGEGIGHIQRGEAEVLAPILDYSDGNFIRAVVAKEEIGGTYSRPQPIQVTFVCAAAQDADSLRWHLLASDIDVARAAVVKRHLQRPESRQLQD